MLQIGDIKIEEGAALAPMAGVTDKAMRALCAGFGAVFTVSEMVSAKALTMKDKNTRALMEGGEDGTPYGVQLFGHEPEVMELAVQMIENAKFDFLDINMGCPAPKIAHHGAGSGLLLKPDVAQDMAKRVVKASKNRPVTVKLRIGWDDDTKEAGLEIAKRVEDAGVSLLVVHARTRAQMYTPGINYEAVAKIKQAVKIPVLFNGDVSNAQTAKKAKQETGCDGVAIGRGAQGNPWVFAEIKAIFNNEIYTPPTLRERLDVMDKQVLSMCNKMGEKHAMRCARGVAAAYMHGLKGAAALRQKSHALTYYTDLAELALLAYDKNS